MTTDYRRTRKCVPFIKNGRITGTKRRTRDEEISDFWARVNKLGPDKCWEWTGVRNHRGYGKIHFGRQNTYAHRASYVVHKGRIPDGLCVLHSCDNPPCVNPNHLIAGTQLENIRDCIIKKRKNPPRGESHAHRKVTEEIVKQMRSRYQPHDPVNGACALAREFGLSNSATNQIVNRVTWKHVA